MKSVTVCRLGHNATSQDVAIVFEVIAEINKVHKTGFNSIGQALYYDFRQQPQSMFVAYDQKTMWRFKQLCKERGVSDALIEEYIAQPHERHAVEIQESGKIVLHWHPKDVFIEVEPENLNRYELMDGVAGHTGIRPVNAFFVGPNREIIKAYRRYIHKAKHRTHFSQGLYASDLVAITKDIPYGGAMYIVTDTGMVAKITSNNFSWLTMEPVAEPDTRRRRAAHGYEDHVIGVGRKWSTDFSHMVTRNDKTGMLARNMRLASVTHEGYLKL